MSTVMETPGSVIGSLEIRDDLRARVEALYADYAIALDDLDLEAWPEFFTDPCLYRVTTRENWDRGFPLSTIVCESRGMLQDRVSALRKSMMYAPRAYRRFQSALRIESVSDDVVATRSNFFVVQTLVDKQSEVGFCGVAFDKLTADDGVLKFQERVCVMDTEMLPNSLIYPL